MSSNSSSVSPRVRFSKILNGSSRSISSPASAQPHPPPSSSLSSSSSENGLANRRLMARKSIAFALFSFILIPARRLACSRWKSSSLLTQSSISADSAIRAIRASSSSRSAASTSRSARRWFNRSSSSYKRGRVKIWRYAYQHRPTRVKCGRPTYLCLDPPECVPPLCLLCRDTRLLLLLRLLDPLELHSEVCVVERVVCGGVHGQLGDRPRVLGLALSSGSRLGLLLVLLLLTGRRLGPMTPAGKTGGSERSVSVGRVWTSGRRCAEGGWKERRPADQLG